MIHTLLFRLAGPMQAWGVQSQFSIRDTAAEPTKSGIIGLICAALGRPRSASIDDLRALRLAIRVDHEGVPSYDYQTAMDVFQASSSLKQISAGKGKLKKTEPSVRHYLADAWFTVALSGTNKNLLHRIDEALGAPTWPLALGRKAFVPSPPVRLMAKAHVPLGVIAGEALPTLIAYTDPLLPYRHLSQPRYAVDAQLANPHLNVAQIRMQPDDPLSFASRRYIPRRVAIGYAHPSPSNS